MRGLPAYAALEERSRVALGHGRRDEEALSEAAAKLAQHLDLVRCFDAFGDDRHPEILRQADDRVHDLPAAVFGRHVGDEGPVDLENVERKAVEER